MDSGGLVCLKCRQKMDYPAPPTPPQEAVPVESTPRAEPAITYAPEEIRPAPGAGKAPVESPAISSTSAKPPPAVQEKMQPAPAKEKPKDAPKPQPKPVARAAVPMKPQMSREEAQKAEYKKMMAEYEKRRKELGEDGVNKERQEQQSKAPPPQHIPQPVYFGAQPPQQQAGQPRPGQYPSQQFPPQQQPRQPGYQQQGPPSAGAGAKVCRRCGHTNERWRLSCEQCKSSLG